MKLSIEYCNVWNYLPRAASMASELLKKYGTTINFLTLIPSGGGVFEVLHNGKIIYSKKQTGKFPELKQVTDILDRSWV